MSMRRLCWVHAVRLRSLIQLAHGVLATRVEHGHTFNRQHETEIDVTTALILNIALSAAVFAVVIGQLAWGIATQPRDSSDTLAYGSRRRLSTRQSHVRGAHRRAEPWPA
jgi:hypothetical protein